MQIEGPNNLMHRRAQFLLSEGGPERRLFGRSAALPGRPSFRHRQGHAARTPAKRKGQAGRTDVDRRNQQRQAAAGRRHDARHRFVRADRWLPRTRPPARGAAVAIGRRLTPSPSDAKAWAASLSSWRRTRRHSSATSASAAKPSRPSSIVGRHRAAERFSRRRQSIVFDAKRRRRTGSPARPARPGAQAARRGRRPAGSSGHVRFQPQLQGAARPRKDRQPGLGDQRSQSADARSRLRSDGPAGAGSPPLPNRVQILHNGDRFDRAVHPARPRRIGAARSPRSGAVAKGTWGTSTKRPTRSTWRPNGRRRCASIPIRSRRFDLVDLEEAMIEQPKEASGIAADHITPVSRTPRTAEQRTARPNMPPTATRAQNGSPARPHGGRAADGKSGHGQPPARGGIEAARDLVPRRARGLAQSG